MNVTLGRLGSRLRLIAARHPWLRRLTVLGLAVTAGFLTFSQLRTVDDARAEWGDRVTVLVAAGDHEAGDALRTRRVELPAAARPDSAVDSIETEARATQRVGAGEIITAADLAGGPGPAALAERGVVVVPIVDPVLDADSGLIAVGVEVGVFSDGIELSSSGRIAAVEAGVVFVAVSAADVPAVAAAAQLRVASLVFPAAG